MIKIPEDNRPRSTKNVQFYKSGDNEFQGIKLPINKRKYPTLDALLDDLTLKVPGLAYGARRLATPSGKTRIRDIEQLRHLGSYVCSDKTTKKKVAGVDVSQMNNSLDTQFRGSFITTPRETPEDKDSSPKKTRRRKRRSPKKKLRSNSAPENNDKDRLSVEEPRRTRKKKKSPSRTGKSPNRSKPPKQPEKNSKSKRSKSRDRGGRVEKRSKSHSPAKKPRRKRKSRIPKKSITSESSNQSRDSSARRASEPKEVEEEENVNKSSTRRSRKLKSRRPRDAHSAPGTAEERKEIEYTLKPLDDRKLRHNQRKNVVSRSIDTDEYTLPSSVNSDYSGRSRKRQKSKSPRKKSKSPSSLSSKSKSPEKRRSRSTSRQRSDGGSRRSSIRKTREEKLNDDWDEGHHQAATKIQARYRGYRVRKNNKKKFKRRQETPTRTAVASVKSANDSGDDEDRLIDHSDMGSSLGASSPSPTNKMSDEQAATKIQATYRGYQSRKNYNYYATTTRDYSPRGNSSHDQNHSYEREDVTASSRHESPRKSLAGTVPSTRRSRRTKDVDIMSFSGDSRASSRMESPMTVPDSSANRY